MVRIGVVGSGYMAETHLDAYACIDHAEIVAVTSPNTGASFVETHVLSDAAFDSADAMFDEAELDAVDVCSPTPTHRPLVEAAAERGLAVFCEKSMAGSLSDADAIAEAVADAGISFMFGHVLRFFPGVRGRPGGGRGRW